MDGSLGLYEITNGGYGESYVRCYVWAQSAPRALALAAEKSPAKKLVAKFLFSAGAPEFATEFSDSGWEL